jgi:hypothetical protein
VRLDEPRETQQFEQVRVQRTGPRPPVPAPQRGGSWQPRAGEPAVAEPRPWDAPLPTPSWEAPATSTWSAPPSAGSTFAAATPPPPAPTPPPVGDEPGPHLWTSIARHEDAASHSRHARQEPAGTPPTAVFPLSPPPVAPVEPPPSPMEWLAARSLLEPPAAPSLPELAPHRRRREDESAGAAVDPAAAPTAQRPSVPPPVRIDDRSGYRVAVREDEPTRHPEPTNPGNRLAEILAENGVTPTAGGRRRRRYRDEDEADDVLARVLGRN